MTLSSEVSLLGLSNPVATAAGLFIAIVVSNAFFFVWNSRHPESEQDPSDALGAFVPMAITWAITLLLLLVVVLWERQGLASIGLGEPKLTDLWWGLAGFAVGGVLFLLTKPLITALGLADVQVRAGRLSAFPLWIALPGILTNGFTEEILFRGYTIERFSSVAGRVAVGALIAWLAFVIGHLWHWGFGSTLQIGMWAIVVTVLYLVQGSLWPCIVMHVMNNFAGLVVLPRLSRVANAATTPGNGIPS